MDQEMDQEMYYEDVEEVNEELRKELKKEEERIKEEIRVLVRKLIKIKPSYGEDNFFTIRMKPPYMLKPMEMPIKIAPVMYQTVEEYDAAIEREKLEKNKQ